MGRLDSLTKVWQPVSKKENSEFKPVKLDLISYPAQAEGFGKYMYFVYEIYIQF